MLPPATLTTAVIIVKILRHRIPQSASFRRRLIWTFQSRITGIDMTVTESITDQKCFLEIDLTESIRAYIQDRARSQDSIFSS